MVIALPNDELIPDAELAKRWGVTIRTLYAYENQPDGLPVWKIGGKKYRGVRASAEWLAAQVRRPNPRKVA